MGVDRLRAQIFGLPSHGLPVLVDDDCVEVLQKSVDQVAGWKV